MLADLLNRPRQDRTVTSSFHHTVEPDIVAVNGALLTPTVVDRQARVYSGALYTLGGALIVPSVRPSAIIPYRPTDPLTIDVGQHLAGALRFPAAIYGGQFFYSWGHFLLETLSPSWATDLPPDIPVILNPWELTFENDWTLGFIQHAMPLLKAAWGGREVIVTAKAVQFAQAAFVPARLTALGLATPSFHPRLGDVFARLRAAFPAVAGSRIVYLRRDAAHRRIHPAEAAIQDAIAQLPGVAPLLMQSMSAPDQVAAMGAAEIAIGFTGSQLHNSIFAPRGAHVIEIGDTPGVGANAAQTGLAAIGGHEHDFVPGFEAAGVPRSATEIMADIAALLQRRG